MKPQKTDQEIIKNHKCQIKNCKNKSLGIAKSKFLCKIHYREIMPSKERQLYFLRKIRKIEI